MNRDHSQHVPCWIDDYGRRYTQGNTAAATETERLFIGFVKH
jgi:hypothetical protein